MSATILLASDHVDPTRVASGEQGATLAYALTPGEGPSRNPKSQKNEDSLAVLSIPNGAAGVVADSHWGAWSGEELARSCAEALAAGAPETDAALGDLLLDLDTRYRAKRPQADRSETTLLAAVVRGKQAIWASIADSHVYRVTARGAERLNGDRPIFAGGEPPLRAFADRVGRDTVIETGSLTIERGELLVIASDGLSTEDCALEPAEIARELMGKGRLLDRVQRLVERARRAPGGRDNIALVAFGSA